MNGDDQDVDSHGSGSRKGISSFCFSLKNVSAQQLKRLVPTSYECNVVKRGGPLKRLVPTSYRIDAK